MTLTNLIQIVLSGLAMGAIYTLTAQGLFITHLAANKVNFGQGDFLMLAAFLSMSLLLLGVPVALVAVVVFGALVLLGWGLERVAIRPLARIRGAAGNAYSWVLTTMGFALIVQNVVTLVWGKSAQYSPPLFSAERDNVVTLFGVGFFVEELLIVGAALLGVAAFYAFLFRTSAGKAIYAVAFNPEAAQLLGIDVRRTLITVFVMASLLAAVSGMLVGPIVTVQPQMGLIFTIKALAVASIGGFTNPIGILAGGLLFGVAEGLSNYFDSSFGDLYPLLFVLAFLVLKPSGLFGETQADVR